MNENYQREYYLKNQKRLQEYRKKWREENKEHIQQEAKKYFKSHKKNYMLIINNAEKAL